MVANKTCRMQKKTKIGEEATFGEMRQIVRLLPQMQNDVIGGNLPCSSS